MILTQVEKYETVAAPGFWTNVVDFCHGFVDGIRRWYDYFYLKKGEISMKLNQIEKYENVAAPGFWYNVGYAVGSFVGSFF